MKLLNFFSNFQTVARFFESGQAGEWRAKVNSMNSLQASVAPVNEFLSKAGQSQLATQCEHTEGKLFYFDTCI